MRSLRWGGRHVVIGFAAGGANPKGAIPSIPLNLALLNEREILGCFWGAWKFRDGNETNRKNIERMLEMVRSGKMKPLVSKTYALADYASAFDAMMSRRVVGKITTKFLNCLGNIDVLPSTPIAPPYFHMCFHTCKYRPREI